MDPPGGLGLLGGSWVVRSRVSGPFKGSMGFRVSGSFKGSIGLKV